MDDRILTPITWIGPQDRDEFQCVWQELSQTEKCTRADSVSAVMELAPPELAILAMSRPGEHASAQVAELQDKWQATKFVYVLGAWCCGQKRVSDEHKRVSTFYLHQLQSGHMLEQLRGGAPWDAAFGAGERPASEPTLAVYARKNSYRSGLTESLEPYFRRTVQLRFGDNVQIRGVDIVVWEASPCRTERRAEYAELSRRHKDAQLIALINYPRDFEFVELQALGITVVAQPFHTRDLILAIRSVDRQLGYAAGFKMIA